MAPRRTALPGGGMSTDEIDNIIRIMLSHSSRTSDSVHFLGVFPFDLFPLTQLTTPSPSSVCCILNTAPSSDPGEHWVAFYREGCRGGEIIIEFFDSYGHPPSRFGFPIPAQIKVQHNPNKYQSDSTPVCGQYCILYILLRSSLSPTSATTTTVSALPSPLARVTTKLAMLSSKCFLRDQRVARLVSEIISYISSTYSPPPSFSSPTKFLSASSAHLLLPTSTSYIPRPLIQDSHSLSN